MSENMRTQGLQCLCTASKALWMPRHDLPEQGNSPALCSRGIQPRWLHHSGSPTRRCVCKEGTERTSIREACKFILGIFGNESTTRSLTLSYICTVLAVVLLVPGSARGGLAPVGGKRTCCEQRREWAGALLSSTTGPVVLVAGTGPVSVRAQLHGPVAAVG